MLFLHLHVSAQDTLGYCTSSLSVQMDEGIERLIVKEKNMASILDGKQRQM